MASFLLKTSVINAYYRLAKPGIVYGNVLVALGGFFYVSGEPVDWVRLVAMAIGLGLIIASACAANNYLDRDIDARMARTKDRPLVTGEISLKNAKSFALVLGVLGTLTLGIGTNLLTTLMALFGLLVYVGAYTPLKRRTRHALFVGAVAGAMPPVVGYTAVANTLDLTALTLFAFLFVWQIGHFIAIAIYCYDDYTAAGIPSFITRPPTPQTKKFAKHTFLLSLIILLAFTLYLTTP